MSGVNLSNAADISLPGSFPETAIWPGPYIPDSSLPPGEWDMLANGRIFSLNIISVIDGVVTATINSGDFINGTWYSGTGEFTFQRKLPTITQEYTAYLLAYDKNDPKHRLAGTFGNITIGTEAGWYATRSR